MKKYLLLLALCCLFSVVKAQITDTVNKTPPPGPPLPAMGADPDAQVTVFTSVEKAPQFPGGTDSLHRYLTKRIVYPPSLLKKNIGGQVIVSFMVETDGSLSNFKTDKSPDMLFSAEVVRVMKPVKYIHGTQNGNHLRVRSTVTVYFDPDNPDFF